MAKYKKRTVPYWLKKKIAERDNYTCQICGKIGEKSDCGSAIEYIKTGDYDRSWLQPIRFEIDHIVPEFIGGKTVESNLQLACRKCNRGKGHGNGTTKNVVKKGIAV